jgi:hypothetical protein
MVSATLNTLYFSGNGTRYPVQTPGGARYAFIVPNSAIQCRKSTDGGLTWQTPIDIKVSSVAHAATATWYDRWSGINDDDVAIVYIDTTSDDVLCRVLDTTNDTLSTETVVFAGATATSAASLSVVRARGGNLICVFDIDGGTERGAAKSTDNGATWTPIADPTEGTAFDEWALVPGWGADNQDVILIFYDQSAGELSRKVYDDSADTWTETSIATSIVAINGVHLAVSVDLTNSQNVLVAWNGVDAANQDLKCWTVTEAAITAKTDVVLNGTDDQGLAAIGIDEGTGYWWVAYAGKSDGSETWTTSLNVYCKVSQDGGTTWGPESLRTPFLANRQNICTAPRFRGDFQCQHFRDETLTNTDVISMDVNPMSPSVGSSWIG